MLSRFSQRELTAFSVISLSRLPEALARVAKYTVAPIKTRQTVRRKNMLLFAVDSFENFIKFLPDFRHLAIRKIF